jgi:hypothetical protein
VNMTNFNICYMDIMYSRSERLIALEIVGKGTLLVTSTSLQTQNWLLFTQKHFLLTLNHFENISSEHKVRSHWASTEWHNTMVACRINPLYWVGQQAWF